MTIRLDPLAVPAGGGAFSCALAEDLGQPLPNSPKAIGLLSAHLRFGLVLLGCLSLSRILLMLWLGERVSASSGAWSILSGGLRMDLLIVSYALAPALLLALLLGGRGRVGRWTARLLQAYFVVSFVAFLFLEIVTPAFIQEYDSRPNRLFIEYLVHPKEVGSMLLCGYQSELLISAVLTTIAALVGWRLFAGCAFPTRSTGVLRRLALFLGTAPLLFLGARSSLQHRPANPSSVVFSEDHLMNDLCLSSIYSVAFAISQLGDEVDAGEVYGSMSRDLVLDEVRRAMLTVPLDSFRSDEIPTLHHQAATSRPERPLNLVILLQESLGAQFVAELGGQPVTQFLDTLVDESWWFDQMYATGTRSVRGIEAVVSGFLPTPARSTVKLGLSQRGFFSLAEYLGRRDYRTQFIYGGESHFDNMKSFFTGNGFNEIIDQDDFLDPVFSGSWGVSDEDIFEKAHQQLLDAGDEPIFSLVFSVSNHSPWEYPGGRFEPYDAEPATRNNAVRYADYALSTFFEKARRSPYWEHTIFVVVADHDSRVHGASLVPIQHFHIPALIIGPGVSARRDQRVVSQIDLGPTLLSLLGLSGEHPMVGHDLTALALDNPGRAIMQFGSNQAYMEGRRTVVLQPNLGASHYTWDGSSLIPAEPDQELARRALAHALLPSMLYRTQSYRLEK